MKRFIYNHAHLLALVWGLVIFILCAVPGHYLPTSSWLELLSFDKLVHASLFFVLCALLLLIVLKRKSAKRLGWVCALCCIVYGAGLELMQAHVFVARSMDYLDAVANGAGAVIALASRRKLERPFVGLAIQNSQPSREEKIHKTGRGV